MNFLGFESNVVTKSQITISIVRRKKDLGGRFFICRGLKCRVQVTDDLHWMEVADVAYAAFDKLPLPRDCHVEKDADTYRGYRSKSNVDIFNLSTANIKLGSISVSEDDEGVLKSCKVFAARLR